MEAMVCCSESRTKRSNNSRTANQLSDDWCIFIPNILEAAWCRWLGAVGKQGLVGGSRQWASEVLTLGTAVYVLPRDIQCLFLQLVATAYEALRFAQRAVPGMCADGSNLPPDPEQVMRILRNHLAISRRLLTAGYLCPEEWRDGTASGLSHKLSPSLTHTFSRDAMKLLDIVLSRTNELLHGVGNDPIILKDLANLAGAVKRYAFPVGLGQSGPDWGNPLFLARTIGGTVVSWNGDPAVLPKARQKVHPKYVELKALREDGNEETEPAKSKSEGRVAEDRARYVEDVWLGVTHVNSVSLRVWQEEAWAEEPKRHERTKEFTGEDTSHVGEPWFFLNGVATDHYVAQLNAEYLVRLFHRHIRILHNETCGLYEDLLECARGRVQNLRTGALVNAVTGLLTDPRIRFCTFGKDATMAKPIVLISHSQGTIIAANLVRVLSDPSETRQVLEKTLMRRLRLYPKEVDAILRLDDVELAWRLDRVLQHLELYNFAPCSDEYPRKEIPAGSNNWFPSVIEHFVNEHDLVAMLAPQDAYGYPGTVFVRSAAWGHLLNAHYLDGFPEGKYLARVPVGPSRLLSYSP